MTTETNVQTEQPEVQTKRGRGRPRKESAADRHERVPVGGFRDKLTVQGTDPNFYYRWVLDIDATGSRILEHMQAGYVFASPDEGIKIGQTYVFSTPDYGDVLRRPANKQGDFLYLMKLPMEYRKEDLAAKAEQANQLEKALKKPSQLEKDMADGGVYGDIKIT